ncbi:MAG: hypothetical protein KDK36_04180 [Leptospiraceae bacterium]|nr:hypothetical protein [Leptospiraceae bacterium]
MQSGKTIQIVKSLQLQCDISGKIDGLSFYKWKGKNVHRRIGKPSAPPSPSQLECREKFATLQNLSKLFKPIIRETYNTGKKPLTPANLFIKRNGGVFGKNEFGIEENSKYKLTGNRSYFPSINSGQALSLSMTTNSKTNRHPELSRRVLDAEILNIPISRLLDTKFISFRNKFHSKTISSKSNNYNLLKTSKVRSSSALLQLHKVEQEIKSPSWAYRDADYSKLKLTRSNYTIPFTPKLTKNSEELFTLKWDDFTKRYDTIALIIFSPEKGIYHKTEIPITENYWHIVTPIELQKTKNYYYLYCYHSKRKTYSESITLTSEDCADILWRIHQQKKAIMVTKDIYPWSVIDEREDILRFSLLFQFGCLRPSFDIRFYQLKQKNLSISRESPKDFSNPHKIKNILHPKENKLN